jgi:hypothetical protein
VAHQTSTVCRGVSHYEISARCQAGGLRASRAAARTSRPPVEDERASPARLGGAGHAFAGDLAGKARLGEGLAGRVAASPAGRVGPVEFAPDSFPGSSSQAGQAVLVRSTEVRILAREPATPRGRIAFGGDNVPICHAAQAAASGGFVGCGVLGVLPSLGWDGLPELGWYG